MKSKLLSILLAASFILTACKTTQSRKNIWLTDENNTRVEEKEYALDHDAIKLSINKNELEDVYVLIQSKDGEKGKLKEDLIEIGSDEKSKDYIFDNLKETPRAYTIYTDITVDGDKATINDNATPNIRFNLRKLTEADKQAISDAKNKEAEAKQQSKEESFGIVVFDNYLEENTFIKPKLFRGKYNVATQKINDKHTSYIVTYSDKDNKRIKLIFDYTGDIEKADKDPFKELANVDYWYYLENGNEIYNEMNEKREKAINDKW